MYEEPLRMPFVIRYPKEIPAGTRNKDIILNTDFAAMLADYAHVKTPNKSQGQSFGTTLPETHPKIGAKICITVTGHTTPFVRTHRHPQ